MVDRILCHVTCSVCKVCNKCIHVYTLYVQRHDAKFCSPKWLFAPGLIIHSVENVRDGNRSKTHRFGYDKSKNKSSSSNNLTEHDLDLGDLWPPSLLGNDI